jgi:hypothetical protein
MSDAPHVPSRSRASIEVEPVLRGRLRALATGRALRIGFFASRCCSSVVVGDLTATWIDGEPPAGAVALAPLEGVPVVADARLVELLESAGPVLRLAGPPFARHLAVALERPERWIAFLDSPAARGSRAVSGGR